MRYLYSQIDKSNLEWFAKDTSKATLMRLEIADGEIRGLSDLKIQFRYPITAVSGKNGTGKSTILACVACGFHNQKHWFQAFKSETSLLHLFGFFYSVGGGRTARICLHWISVFARSLAPDKNSALWGWLGVADAQKVFWAME